MAWECHSPVGLQLGGGMPGSLQCNPEGRKGREEGQTIDNGNEVINSVKFYTSVKHQVPI